MGEDVDALMAPYCEDDPDAISPRWDYWGVGEAFSGQLRLHPGVTPRDETGCADSARLRDIDIEGMRQHAVANAQQTWQVYAAALAEHGEAKTWQECATGVGEQAARQAYLSQPVIQAIWPLLPWGEEPIDYFRGGRDAFIERARLSAIPGRAMLTERDGWIEANRIDLWAFTYGTHEQHDRYPAHANTIIDTADGNELLTVVDYHL